MCIRDSFFWVELMYYLGFAAFRQVALQFHDKPYDNGEPVSYTHLDVYKRQGLACGFQYV